jgi:hypothetical protein
MLQKAEFQKLPGKGSHTNWIHSLYSGKDSKDAKSYQEREIKQAIEEVASKQNNE